jgi:hypothetical protein
MVRYGSDGRRRAPATPEGTPAHFALARTTTRIRPRPNGLVPTRRAWSALQDFGPRREGAARSLLRSASPRIEVVAGNANGEPGSGGEGRALEGALRPRATRALAVALASLLVNRDNWTRGMLQNGP